MAKRSSKQKIKVFVEVLQNGHIISSIEKPINKRSNITLSADPKAEFSAPLYPIARDLPIVSIDKNSIDLYVHVPWQGFVVKKSKIIEVDGRKNSDQVHQITIGDSASLTLADLRILIRVGQERLKPQSKKISLYKAKVSSLWIGDSSEKNAFTLATLASALIVSSVVYGFLNRNVETLKNWSYIKETISATMVYPRHFQNLPEALAEQYDRSKIVPQAYAYFKNLAASLLGYSEKPPAAVFKSSFELYKSANDSFIEKKKAYIEKKKEESSKISKDELETQLNLAAVIGESYEQRLMRIQDKIDLYHDGLEATLYQRIQTTFSQQDDRDYDFEKYTILMKQQVRQEIKDSYTYNDLPTREKFMYEDAVNVSKYAYFNREKLKKSQLPKELLNPTNVMHITIDPEAFHINTQEVPSLAGINQRLDQLQASIFDPYRKEKIKEPLIGQLDSDLIDAIIRKRKFELQLCFELALRRNQSLAGDMYWQWRLDSRGRISELELLSSDIKDKKMIDCIKKKIERWPFPRPRKGSVKISYPFSFKPARNSG